MNLNILIYESEEGGRKRMDVFTYLKPVIRNPRNMKEDDVLIETQI